MKKIIFVFLLLPFLNFAQQDNTWKLYNNCKVVANGKAGEQSLYEVHKVDVGKLKLKYFPNDGRKLWSNSFIIMDNDRVEILRTNNNKNTLAIDNAILNNQKSIIVYIISKPNDPIMASKIRIRTVPLVLIKQLD